MKKRTFTTVSRWPTAQVRPMKKRTFKLDQSGNVVSEGGMDYIRGELGFSRADMQVIADLCNERGATEWDPIEEEWEKRTGRAK